MYAFIYSRISAELEEILMEKLKNVHYHVVCSVYRVHVANELEYFSHLMNKSCDILITFPRNSTNSTIFNTKPNKNRSFAKSNVFFCPFINSHNFCIENCRKEMQEKRENIQSEFPQ